MYGWQRRKSKKLAGQRNFPTITFPFSFYVILGWNQISSIFSDDDEDIKNMINGEEIRFTAFLIFSEPKYKLV